MRRPEPQKPNRLHTHSKSNPETRPPAPATPRPDAGPRPLSSQQRAYRKLYQTGGEPPTTPAPVPSRHEPTTTRRVVTKRDAAISRVRRRIPSNRRRPNYLKGILFTLTGVLAVECVAALLFSPRLAVRTVDIRGNTSVPTKQIETLVGKVQGQNIVRLAVGKIHDAVLREPTIEKVSIQRVFPNTVRVTVTERQAWASVTTPTGDGYTIDSKLVPFRKAATPEAGLPRLVLAAAPEKLLAPVTVLGRPMTAPGLAEVSECLEWAKARPDFPMETVTIDPTGKLCLNRKGGTQVRLGSATDLPRKLNVLALLMQRYNIADAAYINLYAYDAPAVMPKSAVATASAQGVHATGKRTHRSRSYSPAVGPDSADPSELP